MAKIYINTIVGIKENLSQLELIKTLGEMAVEIDGIEIRDEMFSENEGTKQEELDEIMQIAEENKWDLLISYPADLFDADGLTQEAIDILKQVDNYGFKHVKFNTGIPDGILKVDSKAAQEFFDSLRTKVTIENGQEELIGQFKHVKTALENIQEQNLPIGFTYDMGNWAVMGEDPKEAFHHLKDFITIFHIKNVNQDGEVTLLDDGIISWRQLMVLDVPYIIEYPMPVADITSEVNKLKEAVSNRE